MRGALVRGLDDSAVVLPTIDRRTYRGPEGMRSLPFEGRFDARDPARFSAEVVRARLGTVSISRVTLSPHRARTDPRDDADRPAELALITVLHGALHLAVPGASPLGMVAGDALFTGRPHAYAYRTDGPIVVVASTLSVASLPPMVQRLDDLPIGPIPHSPLADAVVDLLTDLADRLDEPWDFDAEYAARGLIDLETAVLTEILAPRALPPGRERLHAAALEYIERHLGEQDLAPPQIAAALGVSVRYLHHAFDDTGTTVSRRLRERRLDRVAAALRAADGPPALDRLARRYGFTSQEQLARTFRRRYGVSMTEYRSTWTR